MSSTGFVAGALLALSPIASTSSFKPSVRPIDRDPLVVRVAHFKPSETVVVRVVVRGAGRFSRTAHAGLRGGLSVHFSSVKLDACSAFNISAVGSRGSRAAFAMHPPPCGPAP